MSGRLDAQEGWFEMASSLRPGPAGRPQLTGAGPTGMAVLELLRDRGPLSKADLAERMGVARSTVGAVLRQLVALGLVEDGPVAANTGGRPSTLVQWASGLRLLAVAFGATEVKVALTDAGLGQIVVRSSVRQPPEGPVGEAERVVTLMQQILAEAGVTRPDAIGVVAPVWPDDGAELLDSLRAMAVERWGRRPVVGRASAAMVLGERFSGRGRDRSELLGVRLGATLSVASVTGGRLSDGATGRAGDIGHLRVEEDGIACHCGRLGCLDAYASGPAVLRRAEAAAASGDSPFLSDRRTRGRLSIEDVVDAVAARDPASVQIAREAGHRIGRVVAGVVAFGDPELVLLGGILSGLGPDLVDAVRAAIREYAPAAIADGLVVDVGGLGEWAGLIGAAHLASDDLIERAASRTSDASRRNRPGTNL